MALSILNAALNAARNETPDTIVFPPLCKRLRFRKSNCRRCVDICPENVISLDPGPAIKNGCSDCGFCAKVCPTEAFRNQVCPDLCLLNQAKSFPEKKELVIHCDRAESESKYSLSVPCLGRVSENIILGAALLGFEEIRFIKGICSTCRLMEGEKLFVNSITAARVLLESLGLGDFPVNLMEKGKGKEKPLSRREIFSRISCEVKRKTSSYIGHKGKDVAKTLEIEKGERLSPRRRLLRTLLNPKAKRSLPVVEYRPEFPWGKIRFDEETCTACGICIALCPTGAISKKSENDCQVLYFNGSLCTNCSLCKEACPDKAIDFEEVFALRDILEDEPKVAAWMKLTSCTSCGETMIKGKGDICPMCRKRQMWSIHVKG
jgi:ferredoxin